jgi:hypothetical protein
MKKIIFLVNGILSQYYNNGFIDKLEYTDVNLHLNNATYTGKLVEYEGSKIEVFRGLFHQKF